MNTVCPACSTPYAVTSADIGRRIACAKCGVVLVVDSTGLRPETATPPSPSSTPPAVPNLTARLLAQIPPLDRPLLTFGLGTVLVIAFTVLPLIAVGQVERQNAILGEASLDQAAAIRALRERGVEDSQLREAEERWQKRRDEYQDAVRRAEFARARSGYWDRYGLLAGAVVLALGAVGLIRDPERPTALRWVASVILSAQLLLAFQTATPVGCAPPTRSYNPGGSPSGPVDPFR